MTFDGEANQAFRAKFGYGRYVRVDPGAIKASPSAKGSPTCPQEEMLARGQTIDDVNAFNEAIEADSRMAVAQAQWSQCMGRGGFSGVKSVADTIGVLTLRTATVAPDQRARTEIALATADLACQLTHVQPVFGQIAGELAHKGS